MFVFFGITISIALILEVYIGFQCLTVLFYLLKNTLSSTRTFHGLWYLCCTYKVINYMIPKYCAMFFTIYLIILINVLRVYWVWVLFLCNFNIFPLMSSYVYLNRMLYFLIIIIIHGFLDTTFVASNAFYLKIDFFFS